jgi:hypothetical protein
MKCTIAIRSIGLVLLISLATSAATVSLVPSKDNTLIQQTNPNAQLSNGSGDILTGRTGQPVGQSIRRGLVHFDIDAAIPSGATITSATLTMLDVMGNNGDRVVSLHRALQDWGEGTSFQSGGMGAPATNNDATWLYTFYNAAAPGTSPTWSTPGGDFNPTASASTVVLGNTMGMAQSFQWSSSGMVADLQDWLDNPSTNYGWLVQGDESVGMTAKRLRGRTNNTTPNPDGPLLTITYVPEPGAVCIALVAAAAVWFWGRVRRA